MTTKGLSAGCHQLIPAKSRRTTTRSKAQKWRIQVFVLPALALVCLASATASLACPQAFLDASIGEQVKLPTDDRTKVTLLYDLQVTNPDFLLDGCSYAAYWQPGYLKQTERAFCIDSAGP